MGAIYRGWLPAGEIGAHCASVTPGTGATCLVVPETPKNSFQAPFLFDHARFLLFGFYFLFIYAQTKKYMKSTQCLRVYYTTNQLYSFLLFLCRPV